MARVAKADDDINVLALASNFTKEEDAVEIVDTWLKTNFKNEERHVRRLNKISDIEKEL